MAESPNYQLHTVSSNETAINLIDWVQMLAGDVHTSNMMRIDAILATLDTDKANKIVESQTKPSGLRSGDEWDRLL